MLGYQPMSTFADWLSDMQDAGLIGIEKSAKPKSTAAEMLGVTDDTITNWLNDRVPVDKRTLLACRALLHRLEPYS